MSSSARALRLAFVIAILGFQQTYLLGTPRQQPPVSDPSGSRAFACTPDSPTVVSGESIKVRAWLDGHSDKLRYVWTADAGSIRGQGAEADWDFKGVSPGVYEGAVTVAVSNNSPTCKLEVIVRERPMGGMHTTPGRSLLPAGTSEGAGYGLYSYVLFRSPPDASSRDRFLGLIDAYLQGINEVEKLERLPFVERTQLNITYLPVDAPAPSAISSDWALAHYDYARAQIMLAKLPGTHMTGPYIVSLLRPLSATQTISGPYLFQDLSLVPSENRELLTWWLREFQAQAAQEHFWEERTGPQLVLKLRTIIGVLATAVPQVRNGLSTAIQWVR